MLVDTGADATVLSRESFDQLNLPIRASNVVLNGVGNVTIPVVGCCNVTFRFNSMCYSHFALVSDILEEGIIGLDFLRRYNFNINLRSPSLQNDIETVLVPRQDTN